MDIKLKNKYLNRAALVLAIYLIGLSLLLAFDFTGHTEYLKSNSYFNSSLFKNDLSSFFYNVRSFHIDYRDYENKSGYDKVGENQVNKIKESYSPGLQSKEAEIEGIYRNYINEVTNSEDTDKIKLLMEERDRKLKEAKDEFTLKADEEIKKIIAEKDKDYNDLKQSLSQREDIKYYIKDSNTGEVYSNINDVNNIKDYIKNNALYSIEFPREIQNQDYIYSNISSEFKSSNLGGYFIIPKEVSGYNQMIANYNYYNSIRERIIIEGALFVICLGIAILILLYLKKNKELFIDPINKFNEFIKRMPVDIRAFAFIIILLITLEYSSNTRFFYFPLNIDHIFKLTVASLLTVYILLSLLEWVKLIKNKEEVKIQWESSILNKFISLTKESSVNKSILFKIISIFILTGLFCMFAFLTLLGIHDGSEGLVLISLAYIFVYTVTIPFYVLKRTSLLNKIIKGSEEIANGNLNYEIKETSKGHLSKLAHNINNMKEGYKKSLDEQIKSERLKSELITNVSHDLKTPLTSIINYVDLLKKEDLSPEEVQGYVGVLDRKAQRLKNLIEDLFEASKVSSGAVELNMEEVDVAALLTQALGEFDEKIKDSSLAFKVNIPTHKVYANLDGKKTWRVFENLISNALKYSQSNTRVYIDLVEKEDNITLTFKNISSYEMNFNTEEIFERFKRGDESRNTEGSGLGLAIAKSIVELQGGKLNIEIDGDLFKAIVEFKKNFA